ncbi:MAG TPA: metallophosphoesterase, partial [Solirubrobacteraceae bacterium]
MRWVVALLGVVVVAVAVAAPSVSARVATKPWPPATGPGQLFIHFGEEHINDEDGATLLPKVAAEVARYKPVLVTTSGDKANDGVDAQFTLWDGAMAALDRAGVPLLAGAGNHDRTAPAGILPGTLGLFELTTPESFNVYRAHFAKRPYPWGDGKPYPGIGPAERPDDDPAGAAATYYADAGNVRWIFLDNSCWSLSSCDSFQLRADGGRGPQLQFLRAKAAEATELGKLVFVVMHIPTEDPRDQSYTDSTAQNHVMGKGLSPRSADNQAFERAAEESGVDAVFLGHIKGQFLYRGRGDIPYYIDGGAGGELYTTGPVGTDHGYWHGFRLVRVDGQKVTTDTVPILVENGITIEGPDRVAAGTVATFAGFGHQPVFKD